MKIRFHIFIIFLISNFSFAQTNSFKIEEKFTTVERAKQISDSLKLPILISDKFVYSIGDSCYKNFIEGTSNGRENDGNNNNRDKEGNYNERNKGGAVADRQRKGKNSKRNKDGIGNDREDDGDVNNRDKDGTNNNRNADGTISNEPHCSNTSNGKLLLYTRHNIESKTAYIYFNNQTFNNKYFKIKKL